MVSGNSGAGGAQILPGGNGSNGEPVVPANEAPAPNPNDAVSYETHRKLLAEKKKAAEELAATRAALDKLEAEKREREEADLKAKEDFKSLLAIREKELNEIKAESEKTKRQVLEARKLDSFLRSVNGVIDRRYWGLIDTDQIIVDPTTGEIDPLTVTKAAEAFRQTYPEIVAAPGRSIGMPTAAPTGGRVGLTYKDWLALPANEMAKRRKEVID